LFQKINLSFYADLYSALTGIDTNAQDLLKAGERICNMRKAFNLREGVSRFEDTPPKRFLSEPLTWGTKTKAPLDKFHIKGLVDDYYNERGWNEDGKMTNIKVRELDLNEFLHGEMFYE
jgi:aldehyde:ferredoxin oxidoreductase